ncbi:MBL fold metallo-hydrolase [Opitutus sp. ER46]|uniref:MBL fold metallo-hydrolase n=1 Tax=Opitutus sp. ER46 TaxID=2161864 RepID=UPI001E3E984C|nr:MBL fold metallo-hydrolase [Opitutus sp. ER46]
MIRTSPLPLEDELGDVLEKGMRRAGLTEEALAEATGVAVARILDAVDYRSELTCDELRRIAGVLKLNEVGLCALGLGKYPQPEIGGLPFCVWPLRMPHGIGVANAYLVSECGSNRALLFDTGAGMDALDAVWPGTIRQVDAVFLTHVEAEHAGGLCEVVARFGVAPEHALVPGGAVAPCGRPMGEGERRAFGALEVTAYSTPGHTAAHNCYVVRAPAARSGGSLLISGDLIFAGSVGRAFYSGDQLQANLQRMLTVCLGNTVVAPGHGPLTTVENERRFNPFFV